MANAAQPPARITTKAGLVLSTAVTHQSDVFERFYDAYDKAFVLPNEKEDRAGFARCFELNFGAAYERLSQAYGPYSEVCLVAEEGSREIGGANFLAMPVNADTITANLNYIFTHQAARRTGRLSLLLEGVKETLAALYPGRSRILMFVEQNDPFRMSAEDYARDSAYTGLDQFERLRIWARRGAQVVDFDYVQPPLSVDQQPDDTLVYSVLGAEAESLNACVFQAHLLRFFGVSVLKGAPLDGSARTQIEALGRACAAGAPVGLLDPTSLLSRIKGRADIARWRTPPQSFRHALGSPFSA